MVVFTHWDLFPRFSHRFHQCLLNNIKKKEILNAFNAFGFEWLDLVI